MKTYFPPSSTVEINLLPVWLQKASISLTEPASVEIISNILPVSILDSVILVFKIGNGQFKPDASKVSSAILGLLALLVIVKNKLVLILPARGSFLISLALILISRALIVKYNDFMIKSLIILLFIPMWANALIVPEFGLSETLEEKKRGNDFLQLIWDTNTVIEDVEAQVYLKKLGSELVTYSESPGKHFDFFFLNDNSINAFAGPYGYIGVHTGMLLSSDSEAELAGVLSHEISHITQNHLNRFSEKTDKQTYIMVAGMLAAVLVENKDASQAIAASTVAGTAQQNINFTRDHEWEADRIGTKMLSKSGFNPKGMAHFFEKLKDSSNAQEFLRSHPLSINRISDSMQLSSRKIGKYRDDSFEYLTIKAKIYYHQHKRIKLEENKSLNLYMQAYDAFEEQNYQHAKTYIDDLLKLNGDNSTRILAGRIYSKLSELNKAQEYFSKILDNEASVYYAAKSYLDNKQTAKGIGILKSYLRFNQGTYQSYKLLSLLYVDVGKLDRAHIHNAEALILQGRLEDGIARYERAKSITSSQDLFDILSVKIENLQQKIDLYKDLSN